MHRNQEGDILMKSALRALLLFSMLMTAATQSMGWGGLGHRTTGQIAQAYLTPQARQAVQTLLKGQSLADAATWADSIKGDSTFNHASWYHFEKMQDGVPYMEHLNRLPADIRTKGGVMQAILLSQRVLESPTETTVEKEMALKFLVHFIGDLHQPLHTGRPEDKGGVKINVNWFNTPTSLHGIWDTGMIMTGHADLFQNQPPNADYSVIYARWLLQAFPNNVPPNNTRDNPESWLNESLQQRPRAYDPTYNTDQAGYLQRNLPVVDWRVHTAGLRIADTLNRIFGRFPPAQVQMTFQRAIESIVGRLDALITLGPRGTPVPPEESFPY